MGNFPLLGFGSRVIYYPTDITDDWLEVLAKASTAHEFGNWTEVIASTPYDCILHWQRRHNNSSSDWYAFEIGVGASSSEVTIVEPVICAGYTALDEDSMMIPIMIPEGTRVSIRAQCSASKATPTSLHTLGAFDVSGFKRPRTWGCHIDALGWISSTTRGTEFDPGSTTNTKGAWTEVVSATDYDYKGFFLSSSADGMNGSFNVYWACDVGFGSSGSEVAVMRDWHRSRSNGTYLTMPISCPIFPIPIPEGTRLSIRGAASTNTIGWREQDLVIHGIR